MHQPFNDGPEYTPESSPEAQSNRNMPIPGPGDDDFFGHQTAMAWCLVQEGFADFKCIDAPEQIALKNEQGHDIVLVYQFDMNERGMAAGGNAEGEE